MLGNVLDDNARDRLVRNVIDFMLDNLFTEDELIALDKIFQRDTEKYYKEDWINKRRNRRNI